MVFPFIGRKWCRSWPEDLEQDALPYFVYLAERNATGALLKYYRTAVTASFESTVEAIKQFARAFLHLTDERDCIRIARALTIRECLRLYPLIRHEGTADARRIVSAYTNTKQSERVNPQSFQKEVRNDETC